MALVFASEVPLQVGKAILPACGAGFQNALGGLGGRAPPEVAMHLEWAGGPRVDGATCGRCRVDTSTLVTFVAVSGIEEAEVEALADMLAEHVVAHNGAPHAAATRPVAAKEIGQMPELRDEHHDNAFSTVARADPGRGPRSLSG